MRSFLSLILFVGFVVALVIFYRVGSVLLRELFKRRDRRNSGVTFDQFVSQLSRAGASPSVSNAIWDYFRAWMWLKYPLMPSDQISEIVSLEGREVSTI